MNEVYVIAGFINCSQLDQHQNMYIEDVGGQYSQCVLFCYDEYEVQER